MRWFKHMTSSWEDQKLSAAIDELGLEGYGFWWRMLEIIAKQLDEGGTTNCSYSSRKWGEFFGISAKKFEKFAGIFKKFEIFQVNFSEKYIEVNIPNLLKYKDEWTRKKAKNSGVTPEKLRCKDTDTDIDNIKEKIKKEKSASADAAPPPPKIPEEPEEPAGGKKKRNPRLTAYSPDFETFWKAYPRKSGKDAAWKAWQKRRHEIPALPELAAILARQSHCEQWQRDGGQFIPHPATWLNQGRWQDEVEATQGWTPKPANW